MRQKKQTGGMSLTEALLILAVLSIIITLSIKGLDFVKASIYQHFRLAQFNSINAISHEIITRIRGARKIRDVRPDRLDLEVYDFSSYQMGDKDAIEKPLRLVYRFNNAGAKNLQIIRETYVSTQAGVAPLRTNVLYSNQKLIFPSDTNPYFTPTYFVGSSTVGVRVSIRLQSPFFRDVWVPVKTEAKVLGRGI